MTVPLALHALTVRQPVASLLVLGARRHLVWTPVSCRLIGRRVAIHAGRRLDPFSRLVHGDERHALLAAGWAGTADGRGLPLGAVVGTCVLDRVIGPAEGAEEIARAVLGPVGHRALRQGEGRVLLTFRDPWRLARPIPAPGRRDLWPWTPPDALDPRALGFAFDDPQLAPEGALPC